MAKKKGPEFMITAKDRLYFSDIMSHILTFSKKNKNYLEVCEDVEVANMLTQINDILENQYETCLQVLEDSNE
ncbi:MAG: hypothetical protein E7184_00620 [Erysipelotrichaceae bacterium]|nr:hypothetical protein [Erysipelotrichaceae bacterium]